MFLTPSSSRARQVVVVDHVMPLLRAEQDRDHLMPEKLAAVPLGTFAPVLSLLLDLAHPDRDLGRAQLREGAGSRRAARRRCLWKGQGPGQKPASILGQPDWGRRLRRLVSLRLGAGPAHRERSPTPPLQPWPRERAARSAIGAMGERPGESLDAR